MSASLLIIVAMGAQDAYLTGTPDYSFFRKKISKHTMFALELTELQFNGTPDFGRRVHTVIQHAGDLLGRMYVKCRLPAVEASPGDVTSKFAWCRRLGFSMINSVEVEIGSTRIDKQYGLYLNMWYELTVPLGRQPGVLKMIGDYPELTKLESAKAGSTYVKREDTIYVPLQFWHCSATFLYIPLIALQYHETRVYVDFNESAKITLGTGEFATPNKRSLHLRDASLVVEYVYLDAEERNDVASVGHEHLITQVQHSGVESILNTTYKYKLPYNHPVKELLFFASVGNYSTSKKFLAYSHTASWAGALSDATRSIAEGMLKLNADGTLDTSAGPHANYDTTTLDAAISNGMTVTTGTSKATVLTANFTYAGAVPPASVSVSLFSGAVLLGTSLVDLRDRFSNLIYTVTGDIATTLKVSAQATVSSLTIRDLSVPLADGTWVTDLRNSWVKSMYDVVVNQPTNSGMYIDGTGQPVRDVSLQLNNVDKFIARDSKFFNSLHPYQHHTNTPSDGKYVISFAFDPESVHGSGTVNMSRIDSVHLNIAFQDFMPHEGTPEYPLGVTGATSQFYVFAPNFNVLRYAGGLGGLGYSS